MCNCGRTYRRTTVATSRAVTAPQTVTAPSPAAANGQVVDQALTYRRGIRRRFRPPQPPK